MYQWGSPRDFYGVSANQVQCPAYELHQLEHLFFISPVIFFFGRRVRYLEVLFFRLFAANVEVLTFFVNRALDIHLSPAYRWPRRRDDKYVLLSFSRLYRSLLWIAIQNVRKNKSAHLRRSVFICVWHLRRDCRFPVPCTPIPFPSPVRGIPVGNICAGLDPAHLDDTRSEVVPRDVTASGGRARDPTPQTRSVSQIPSVGLLLSSMLFV